MKKVTQNKMRLCNTIKRYVIKELKKINSHNTLLEGIFVLQFNIYKLKFCP